MLLVSSVKGGAASWLEEQMEWGQALAPSGFWHSQHLGRHMTGSWRQGRFHFLPSFSKRPGRGVPFDNAVRFAIFVLQLWGITSSFVSWKNVGETPALHF